MLTVLCGVVNESFNCPLICDGVRWKHPKQVCRAHLQAHPLSASYRREFTAPSMKLGPIATKMGRRASVNVLIAAAITNTLPGLLNTRRVFTASAEMVGASDEP